MTEGWGPKLETSTKYRGISPKKFLQSMPWEEERGTLVSVWKVRIQRPRYKSQPLAHTLALFAPIVNPAKIKGPKQPESPAQPKTEQGLMPGCLSAILEIGVSEKRGRALLPPNAP